MIPPTDASVASRNSDWAPLLEESAREVFELMLGCELVRPAAAAKQSAEITAVVGFAGQLCGLLSIQCGRNAAALMASKMLGMALDQVQNEVLDAFGEVGNMVAGNFKNKVPGLGDGCMLSVPTVVTGSNYSLYSNAAAPAIQLLLLFENMPILISLQISK